MKNRHHNKILLLVVVCITTTLFIKCNAQEAITCSSGYFEAPSLSLSWTLGEIAVETYRTGNITLTQGFNQSNIIITDITDELSTDLNITVYPNPVQDFLTIRTLSVNPDRLTAELYNLSGKILLSQLVSSDGNTLINIKELPKSDYILRISTNQQAIKSFKIIKTD